MSLIALIVSVALAAPLPPPGFMDESLQMIRDGRLDEARTRLEPVVAIHPDWGRAHLYLGLTYHKQNRYERARELFQRSLDLEPGYHPTRVYLGWALYYLGELDASRAMFESFLEVRPDYPDAIFALALIDFDDDDLDRAIERLKTVIRLAKQDPQTEAKARARLADVWIRRDGWEAARDELQKSVALNPDNHEAYFKLSRVLLKLGDEDAAGDARARYEEALARRARPKTGMGP